MWDYPVARFTMTDKNTLVSGPKPPSTIKGLSTQQAAARLAETGPNVLPERRRPGPLLIFIRQFKSPFIYVLFAAALVSLGLGQTINAAFIAIVLLLNAMIGTIQEYAAQRAATALKKMVPSRSTVVRDGRPIQIDTSTLVVGDYVLLSSGDKVPADIHLFAAHNLHADESMLTGESNESHKQILQEYTDDAPLADRHNMCFAGTVILRGRGEGQVIATGSNTEIGKIARDVGVGDEVKPPLLVRIERFTQRITYGILILISLIFIITVVRGDDLATVFLLAVALAVSAIPEGLPAAITVALAIGMRRMARKGVIIRRLLAVESLGSCTYIASDKTGTLTVNEMTIQRILLPNGNQYEVSGEGIDLHGIISPTPSPGDALNLRLLCSAGGLANEAWLEKETDDWIGHGDRVDVAFLVLSEKYGVDYESLQQSCPELAKIPYESENAIAASINRCPDGIELQVKGSVEQLLTMSSSMTGLAEPDNAQIEKQIDALAKQGFRVLGLAHRKLDQLPSDPLTSLEKLEFIGMVGMIDPLRPDAIDAVQRCRDARIKVAMITGDHPQTAWALALPLGIADNSMQPVSGSQLATASNEKSGAFRDLVHGSRVFARVEPHQKSQIVDQLIQDGEFVAVTGDGVNDAPAISHAHVGISMGKRGTDVARESADIILTDDRFSSIVEGIKQGRIVYNNIRKVIFLLISTGAAEITLVLLSLLFGMPLPLYPLQLLWLNLVTNGIQDIALAFEPEEGDELNQPPRSPDEPIFDRLMIERVLVNALVMGVLAFATFTWQIQNGASVESARNITLLLMVLFENVHVFNSRSETRSMLRQYFFGNPFLIFGMLGAQAIHIGAMYTPGLRDVLQIQPVSIVQWSQLLGIALCLIIVDELHKLIHARHSAR
jgi:magnesium-transporting ATPase (P-type)